MITNLSIGRCGRLGNQIFQYAILKVLSIRNGFEIVLPIEPLTQHTVGRYNSVIGKNDNYKLDLLECFDLNVKFLNSNEIAENIKFQYSENFTMHYDAKIFEIPDNTNYYGFFQCEEYYSQYKKEIKNDLLFKEEIVKQIQEYFQYLKEKFNKKIIVTVHIRRGDNILDNGKFAPVLTKEYYENIFSKLRNSETMFLVVSDDQNWCREFLSAEDVFVSELAEKNTSILPQILDFYQLSFGDKIIISASTFSWWAAWLSEASEIYAPDRWYGTEYKNHNEEGIRPEEWILCKVLESK
jgi:hypothetical protein